VRHVVAFRFKDDVTQDAIDDIVRQFRGLATQIPTILSLEAGLSDLVPYDLDLDTPDSPTKGLAYVFVVTFANTADRDDYVNVEPHHQAFKAKVGPLLRDVFVFDFAAHGVVADPQAEQFERIVAVRPSAVASPADVSGLLDSLREDDAQGYERGGNDSTEGANKGMTLAAIERFGSAGGLGNGVGRVEQALAQAKQSGLIDDAFVADVAAPTAASGTLYDPPMFGPVRALTCNDGAARVDRTDYGEPTVAETLTLVVGDAGVTRYLRDAAAAFGPKDALPGAPPAAYFVPQIFDTKGRLVLTSSGSDLSFDEGAFVDPPDDPRNSSHAYLVQLGARAYRDGPGLKVVLYRPAIAPLQAPEREVANWYFESCR
jgi:hypothetical protein